MVHTTRRTYKSRLENVETAVVAQSLEGHKTADALYSLIEHEGHAKVQLMNDIGDLGEMAVDVVRKLDENRTRGKMTFTKCEELNDDHIRKFSAFDIINRIFDILMICEERVDEYGDRLDTLANAEEGIHTKLQTLDNFMVKAQQMQHELYNIGPNATDAEIQAFRVAEEAGSKFNRTVPKEPVSNTRQSIPTPPAEEDVKVVEKQKVKATSPITSAKKTKA